MMFSNHDGVDKKGQMLTISSSKKKKKKKKKKSHFEERIPLLFNPPPLEPKIIIRKFTTNIEVCQPAYTLANVKFPSLYPCS